jgi:hypothetical protein
MLRVNLEIKFHMKIIYQFMKLFGMTVLIKLDGN